MKNQAISTDKQAFKIFMKCKSRLLHIYFNTKDKNLQRECNRLNNELENSFTHYSHREMPFEKYAEIERKIDMLPNLIKKHTVEWVQVFSTVILAWLFLMLVLWMTNL